MTKKLGLIASILTPISCGLAIAPFSVSSSHFCCSSTRSVFGYHGTSFNLSDGGRAPGMCMTASTFPNAPLYLGRSGPNTCLNCLHASANCCFTLAGRRLEGSIVILSRSSFGSFLAGAVYESVMVSGSTIANDWAT